MTPPAGPASSGPAVSPAGPTASVIGPITIGILQGGDPSSAAKSFGANNGNTFSANQAQQAVIDGLNAAGGLAGRKIVPVFYQISPTSTNYETDLAAACAHFTQDVKTALVVSSSGYYSTNFEQCLAKSGTPSVEGGYAIGDSTDMSTFPDLVNSSNPTVNRRISGMLTLAHQNGWLRTGDKLGVIVDDCAYNTRAYNSTLVPLARHLGLAVDRADLDCTTGYGSLGAASSSIQSAVLRFHTDNVTQVMLISSFEATGLLLFAEAAESQHWTPTYLLSSLAGIAAEQGNYPGDQLSHMHGAGWAPSMDVTVAPATTPAQRRCLALLERAGVRPSSNTDLLFAYTVCDPFFLLDAALGLTHGDAAPTALVAGVDRLEGSFSSAFDASAASFARAKHDGTATMRAFAWSVPCDCFRYQSGPTVIP